MHHRMIKKKMCYEKMAPQARFFMKQITVWRNLGATENQIQCLILLDVEARIHEEA